MWKYWSVHSCSPLIIHISSLALQKIFSEKHEQNVALLITSYLVVTSENKDFKSLLDFGLLAFLWVRFFCIGLFWIIFHEGLLLHTPVVCKSCIRPLDFLHFFKLRIRKSNCSLKELVSSKFQLGFIFIANFNAPI